MSASLGCGSRDTHHAVRALDADATASTSAIAPSLGAANTRRGAAFHLTHAQHAAQIVAKAAAIRANVVLIGTEPYASLLSLLSSPAFSIVPAAEAQAAGDGFGRRPLGSGPFRLERWEQGEILLLAAMINITPGSVALDVSSDRKTMYVHVMHITTVEEAKLEIKEGFERRILSLRREQTRVTDAA